MPSSASSAMLPLPAARVKRRQVKNACTNCQKACKKCDDARPCLRCVKYGMQEACVSSQRKERKKGVKRGPYKKRESKGPSLSPSPRVPCLFAPKNASLRHTTPLTSCPTLSSPSRPPSPPHHTLHTCPLAFPQPTIPRFPSQRPLILRHYTLPTSLPSSSPRIMPRMAFPPLIRLPGHTTPLPCWPSFLLPSTPSIPSHGQTPSCCIPTSSTPSMAITPVHGRQRTPAEATAPIDQPCWPSGILVLFIIHLCYFNKDLLIDPHYYSTDCYLHGFLPTCIFLHVI